MSTRESRPDALIIGAPKAGHQRAARRAGAAPAGVRVGGQGTEVLHVHRRAAAGVRRSGRRAQPAGVGLAGRRLRGALRPGARRLRPAGEHAVLPLPALGAATDRRGAAGRQARRRSCATRSTVPTRTGCTSTSTASSRRPTSSTRAGAEEERVRRRVGAVLALPPDGPLRRAARRPLRARRPRAGAGAALLPAGQRTRRDPGHGGAGSSGSRRVWSAPSRRTTPAASSGPGCAPRRSSRAIRLGAAAGAYVPPQVWRRASRPLTRALQHGGPDRRPRLSPEQRSELLAGCTDDIAVLEDVLGQLVRRLALASRAAVRSPNASRADDLDRAGSAAPALTRPPRTGQSDEGGHQVVRTVGAGGLEVEAAAAVGAGRRR